jgi:alpha-tubulin suppressor-like RCC1 family protein
MSAAAYCWGNVPNGATRASNATPTPVAGNIKFANLATGSDFVCGVSTDKRMYCWGNNTFGQLGDGTVVAHAAPARVAIVP